MPAPYYETEIAALETQLAAAESEIQSGGFGGDKIVYSPKADILKSLAYFRGLANANRKANSSTLAAFERE